MRCMHSKLQARMYQQKLLIIQVGECTYLCFRAALLNVSLRLVSFQARDEGLDVLGKLPKLLRHTWGRC